MAHRSATCGRDPVRNTLLDSSTHKPQPSSKQRRSSTPETTLSSSVAFGRTDAHRNRAGDARRNSRGSCISRGSFATKPASTLTYSPRAQRRASMGLSAGAAVGTALTSKGDTSELTALQPEDWPGFVAFFRGASSYVQVSTAYTSPVPTIGTVSPTYRVLSQLCNFQLRLESQGLPLRAHPEVVRIALNSCIDFSSKLCAQQSRGSVLGVGIMWCGVRSNGLMICHRNRIICCDPKAHQYCTHWSISVCRQTVPPSDIHPRMRDEQETNAVAGPSWARICHPHHQ